MPKITAVLPALSLLTLTLLASCGTSVLPQPARVPITSVNLTVSPVTGWTPTTETILLSAYGSGVPHLVGQGTLAAGKATLTLPGEAALGAALYTVERVRQERKPTVFLFHLDDVVLGTGKAN